MHTGVRRATRSAPRLLLVILVIVAWTAALTAWGSRAEANNWGSNAPHKCDKSYNSQCVAKDGHVKVYFTGSFDAVPGFRTQALNAFSSEYNNHGQNPNDWIKITEVSNINNGDAWLYYQFVDINNIYAFTKCTNSATYGGNGSYGKRWCEPQKVVFNSKYSGKFDGAGERRAYACHEIGHVFGLRHRGNYCMKNPPTSSVQDLGGHDMQCLVKYYPNGNLDTGANPPSEDCP